MVKTTIIDVLDAAKAEDIVAIDLTGKTNIADTMVIATGTSSRHILALADRIARALKTQGQKVITEGTQQADWVLLDCGDVIVHLFRDVVRDFYNLESIWCPDMEDGEGSGTAADMAMEDMVVARDALDTIQSSRHA